MTDLLTTRALSSRLARGALGAAVASLLVAVMPLLGRLYLSDEVYAVWALCSTLATMGLLLDFGAPALATRWATRGSGSRGSWARLLAASAGGSLALGVMAVLVWPAYARGAGLSSDDSVISVLALVSVGSALRSVTSVYAAAALGRGRYWTRSLLLAGPALLQVLLCFLSLRNGLGLHALPLSTCVAGALGVVLALTSLRLPGHGAADASREIFVFVRVKGVATLLGLALTQLDRWVVGLAGSPSVLATYDVAARFAVLPKMLVLTTALGLVGEGASRQHDRQGALHLLRQSSRVSFALVVAGSVLAGVPGVAFARRMDATEGSLAVVLTVLMLVWHGVHTMTAPGVLILNGLGCPHFELRYLVPAAGTAALGYVAALVLHAWPLAVTGLGLGLVVWSGWFLVRQRGWIRVAAG